MPNNTRFTNPDSVHKPTGYSHVAEVVSGHIVYIAGQVALGPDGNVVGEGDMEAQTRQIFENLKAHLAAVGGDFSNVIKLTYYLTDREGLAAVRKVRNEYINADAPPASTLVVVSGLALPAFLVEVEAVAALP